MCLYLVALLTPHFIDEQVNEWKQYMLKTFGCKNALKSPAHITLIAPFKGAPSLEDSLHKALQDFASARYDFIIDLQDFGSFPPRVIYTAVVKNEFLQKLQPELEEYLLKNNYPVKKEGRPFHPHITIANRDLQQKDFESAWDFFREKTFQASFNASSIALLRHNGKLWQPVSAAPFTHS